MAGRDRIVVVFPGAERGPRVPLLDYGVEAAEVWGADPMAVLWRGSVDRVPTDEGTQRWIEDESRRVLDEVLAGATRPDVVVMAKSMGTLSAPVVADLGLPAVWFTPVLTDAISSFDSERVVAAMARSTAPALLVGGTGDDLWHGSRAAATGKRVLEIPGADHSLHVPGPLARSAAVLGDAVTAVEAFLADLWGT